MVQVFEFITVTFEMYYECRLLSVAYNRMDRHISLRHKGLGAYQVNDKDITKHNQSNASYIVKSKHGDREYIVDTEKWTCTCSVGITGFPRGEPCRHQHAVANKYKMNSPNLIPFNSLVAGICML